MVNRSRLSSPRGSHGGFTFVELLCVLALMSIAMGIAVTNFRGLLNPLNDSAAHIVSHLKRVRAKAISSTSAYTVTAASPYQLTAAVSARCDDPSPTTDPALTLELASGTSLIATDWSVCFSSRGFADADPEIPVRNEHGQTKTIKVYIGGAARIL